MQSLKTVVIVILSLCLYSYAQATSCYGVSVWEGIYTVDFDTGLVDLYFSTPSYRWHDATSGNDGQSFYATLEGGSLYQINIITKNVEEIGLYGIGTINGLAYDVESQILYGIDGTNLYTINTTTGAASLIGSTGKEFWAFEYDPITNNLIGVNGADESMYYIDPSSGQITKIGPTGIDRITDIWFNHSDNTMYGVGNGYNGLCTLNTITGVGTSLFGDYRYYPQKNIMGLGNPIPEPCTVSLFALGGLLLRSKNQKP